jgi:chemotaxis protein methyltransferase CheR
MATPDIQFNGLLAQAIVDTVREPLLVLDKDLRVVLASRSFYLAFGVNRQETEGRLVYALGDGHWDIPALRELLVRIAPDKAVLEDYEIELDLPKLGHRILLLNARKLFYEDGVHNTILLTVADITDRRAAERERDQLLLEKDLLLQEMQHRVANSLQIIASILLMKARRVTSEETRTHLHDAHRRVLAVAAVQKHLHATIGNESIDLAHYLKELSVSLAASMIVDGRPISIEVQSDEGRATSRDAVSIGLIVTELVINAVKYAFPDNTPGGIITVAYDSHPPDWCLTVSDNGIGKSNENNALAKPGLGTSIVAALAGQLDAQVETTSSPDGLSTSIRHAALPTIPEAA